MEQISYERRVYELVEDKSLSCDISQKLTEKLIMQHTINKISVFNSFCKKEQCFKAL